MAWLASIKSWFQGAPTESAAAGCYAALVTQARQPDLYMAGQVPDTPQGRFELVMLHAFLVMRRLHRQKAFTQALFDLMFADFDVNLRELGVGDLGVGKRVKSWAQAFKGRAIAYDEGLAGTQDLAAALVRNIAGCDGMLLAAYVDGAATMLASQSEDDIMTGTINWPEIRQS